MNWDDPALALWAKSDRNTAGRWHPLIGHSLDVAASFWALLEREPEQTRILFARELGVPLEALLPWGAALAGLHDIGKAIPYFQMQWKKKEHYVAQEVLLAHGYAWSDRELEGTLVPHATASQAILQAALVANNGFTAEGAYWLSDALGAHHGFRAVRSEVKAASAKLAKGRWAEARLQLQSQIVQAVGAAAFPAPSIGAGSGAGFMRFAGLVSVADWIGSNPAVFQARGVIRGELLHDLLNPQLYFQMALVQARHGLDAIGWRGQRPQPRTFEQVFDFKPRCLQEVTVEALEGVNQPVLLLIEAPMGEGKTEAALYAHHLLQRQVGHRGLYFALPTQATSNEMFKRVHKFLEKIGFDEPPDLQLVHGATLLSKTFRELQINIGDERENSGQGVVASEWFTPKKQALLSPHGVGTVDQALLGVLHVGHHFVRLYGLANRTIVFDEVHAYELYTSKLIQRLMQWLHALGSSVVLLSATLPRSVRQSLLTTYGAEPERHETPYPRLMRVVAEEVKSYELKTRALRYDLGEAPLEPEALAHFLISQAEGGGAIGCVVNTVARAQTIFCAIKDLAVQLPDSPELLLLHARFPAWQRQEITERLMERVGTKDKKPRHIIVVATQVIEQSIDADFDVLVSDLAPFDLLLQRAGRLHRHDDPLTFQRPRPERHDRARLYVSGLLREAPLPDLTTHYWHYVYAPAVLLRTWAVLRQRQELKLPDDLNDHPGQPSLLEQVYSDNPLPGEFSAEFQIRLVAAEQKLKEERHAERAYARDQLLPAPNVFFDQPLEEREYIDDDNPHTQQRLRAVTRLGEPSVTILPLFRRDEALYLKPRGGRPIDLNRKPSLDQARLFLRHTVSLSNRTSYERLAHSPGPVTWKKSPLLRHIRIVDLNESGEALDSSLRLRLDTELGVVSVRDRKEGSTV